MSLRISRVRARVLRVPLVEPFAITTATMGECEHVVVTVETDGGIEGQGSVSTIPAFMGETATLIAAAIGFLEPVVVGHDPFDIEAVVEDMDDAIQDNHSAKAAIDFACHDLMGKALGLPVHKLIGGLYRERIPLTWVIGIKPVEQTVAEAIARFADGYRVFKIKVGHDDGDDVEKVRLVREALGPEAIIRLDANTAYSADRGVRVLSRLEPFTLEMIEQPCRKADLKGMARIRDALHTPILADESASGLEEVRALIDMGAADIINIKLGKVGGLHTARKIAAVAKAAGMPVVVGSNMELGPGMAAGAHFAASTRGVCYANDLFAGALLHRHDIVGDVWDHAGMTIRAPSGPGLGVELLDGAPAQAAAG